MKGNAAGVLVRVLAVDLFSAKRLASCATLYTLRLHFLRCPSGTVLRYCARQLIFLETPL